MFIEHPKALGCKLAPQEVGKYRCFYSNNMLLTSKVIKLGQSTHTSVSNGRFSMKKKDSTQKKETIFSTCL